MSTNQESAFQVGVVNGLVDIKLRVDGHSDLIILTDKTRPMRPRDMNVDA